MFNRIKLALQIETPGKTDRHYSLLLKKELVNEPCVFRQPKRMFILSDVEGNFQSFCKFLLRLRIIDKYLNWTFREGHLVILGNCFDRNEEATECLWLIYALEEKARHEGGYVHFILGNHEIAGMNGSWRSLHPKYAINDVVDKLPANALFNGNSELSHWLRTKNLVEKIGSVLMVHGGIAPSLNDLNISLQDINEQARSFYCSPHPISDNNLYDLLVKGENSLVEYRGYFDGNATEEQVDKTLDKFNVSTIVIGHMTSNRLRTGFNNKVINVSTDHANGKSEGLYIKRRRFYRIRIGKKKRIK